MRRTEQVQGLRLMKFEEVYGRTHRGGLSQAEAAEVLGVSERTFRRWRDRYEAEGADGLYDRRLGRLSARRAPVDEVARVLELFDTRYWDFTAKHFHEKLVADHGFKRSYNWLRLSLQAHGRRRAAPRRGAHRQAAAPCPARHDVAPGRLEPRVGPRSMVGPDRHHGRCDQRYLLGLLRRRRGHHVELPGGVTRAKGLFCSLYADRASHYWNTPEAEVDKDTPTQVGRALAQLDRVDPGLLARGKGALGAHVRHLAEAPAPWLAGITDMVEANRFLKEVFLPQHNARFATPAEDRGTAFVPFTGALGHPVHPRGTHRLKRQHGALQAPGTSDPRRPPPPPTDRRRSAGRGHPREQQFRRTRSCWTAAIPAATCISWSRAPFEW